MDAIFANDPLLHVHSGAMMNMKPCGTSVLDLPIGIPVL